MRWQCLQHVPFEGPAHLDAWAQARGHHLTCTRVWTGAPFPRVDDYDALFVMGGPMNVYEEDRYPWLKEEKALVVEAIAAGRPLVGICLGAQLLSVVLGGAVRPNPCKEIGWFPVDLTREGRASPLFKNFPDRFPAFHWHADRFSIPPGAVHVAGTEACAEQGFVYQDRVIGLQFHLESTEESITCLIEHCGEAITCAPYIQDPATMKEYASRNLAASHALFDSLLDALVSSL